MSDQPLTLAILTQFHREVFLPDVERVFSTFGQWMHPGFAGLDAHFEEVHKRFDRLEAQCQLMKDSVRRIEDRLDRILLRSELAELKWRVDGLQRRVRALEARLAE